MLFLKSLLLLVRPSHTTNPILFTATNPEWKKLPESDKYKNIIVNSLRFLVQRTALS
ncbi:MAG: hypothetical protein QM763_14075 [Agriterribacter sp.]